MQNKITLLTIEARLTFPSWTQEWFNSPPLSDIWFTGHEGNDFFSEYSISYGQLFAASAQPLVDGFFIALGVERKDLPQVKVTGTRVGSLEIMSEVVVVGTVGYSIVKAISGVPSVLENLEKLRVQIKESFHRTAGNFTSKELIQQIERFERDASPPHPNEILQEDVSIDSQPLRDLLVASNSQLLHCPLGQTGAAALEKLAAETREIRRDAKISHRDLQALVQATRSSKTMSMVALGVAILIMLILAVTSLTERAPRAVPTELQEEIGYLVEQVDEHKLDAQESGQETAERLATIEKLLVRTNEIVRELGEAELSQN